MGLTEDEIAASLAAKLSTEEPETPQVETKPEETKPDEAFLHGLPQENTLEKQRWLDYFNVPSMSRREPQIDTYLSKVLDWARDESGSSEYTDLLRVINDQERVLGSKIKQDRLGTLYRFAVIRSNRLKLIQEERALYA